MIPVATLPLGTLVGLCANPHAHVGIAVETWAAFVVVGAGSAGWIAPTGTEAQRRRRQGDVQRPADQRLALKLGAGLKATVRVGAIAIVSPVLGLRPLRARRFFTWNVPKPG